jgi:hypothetical protein
VGLAKVNLLTPLRRSTAERAHLLPISSITLRLWAAALRGPPVIVLQDFRQGRDRGSSSGTDEAKGPGGYFTHALVVQGFRQGRDRGSSSRTDATWEGFFGPASFMVSRVAVAVFGINSGAAFAAVDLLLIQKVLGDCHSILAHGVVLSTGQPHIRSSVIGMASTPRRCVLLRQRGACPAGPHGEPFGVSE